MFRRDQYKSSLPSWLTGALNSDLFWFVFDNFLLWILNFLARKLKKFHLNSKFFRDHNMDYVTSIASEFVSGLVQSIVTLFVIIIVVVKIQGKKNFT